MNQLTLEVHVRLNGVTIGSPMTYTSASLPQLDQMLAELDERHRWEVDLLKHELAEAQRLLKRPAAPWWKFWLR